MRRRHGAASAIGTATARAFAREGARLALLARRREHLGLVALELRASGAQALIFPTEPADVSDLPHAHAGLSSALRGVFARMGTFDVVVNAGALGRRPEGSAPRPRALGLDLAIPFALSCLSLARATARGAAIITLGPRAVRLPLGGGTLCFVPPTRGPEAVADAILRCAFDYRA